MDFLNQFAAQHAWVGVVVTVLWSVDQILKVVAPLTKTKIDDNIADYLGQFLAKFFPKK